MSVRSYSDETCKKCNARLREGAAFCSNCGVPFGFGEVGEQSQYVCGQAQPEIELRTPDQRYGFKTIAWLFALLLLTSFVFGLVGRFSSHSTKLFAWVTVVDAVIVTVFFFICRDSLSGLLRIRPPKITKTLLVFAAGLAIWLFMTLYVFVLTTLGISFVREGVAMFEDGWPVWSLVLLTCVVPGILEEITFRGIVLTTLDRYLSKIDALIVQAMVFSVLHLLPLSFVSHFVIGLILGWVCRTTKSLYPSMVLHIGWNYFVLWQNLGNEVMPREMWQSILGG